MLCASFPLTTGVGHAVELAGSRIVQEAPFVQRSIARQLVAQVSYANCSKDDGWMLQLVASSSLPSDRTE